MIDAETYNINTEATFYTYEFVSEGKRKIDKVMKFTPTEIDNLYNLGFGDKDATTGLIDDTTTSNNGDTKKVLATVAQAVMFFTDQYPNYMIFATGVTPARTRLYRMGIQQYWDEISVIFNVLGFMNDDWETFIPNQPYEAFLVKRKI